MKPVAPSPAPVGRSGASVILISIAIIILQLALMRILSVTRWHHFSYFVICTALLGYGISGTVLSFIGPRLLRKYGTWSLRLGLAFAISSAICLPLAEQLPINFQYLLYSKKQIALFAAYNLIVLIPFLIGATYIGLALMHHRRDVPLIYGCSMLGTAIGGAIAVGLMFVLAESTLVYIPAFFGFAAGCIWLKGPTNRILTRRLIPATVTFIIILTMLSLHPPLHISQYKKIYSLQQYESEGIAKNIHTRHSPRGRIDVFSSPHLHDTLFAGLGATTPAPRQSAILRDGELAGTIYEIESAEDAPILDHTPASFPYRLIEKPRVLLLGESGSVNIWLAKRFGASRISVVQSDPVLAGLLKGELSDISGGIFSDADVTMIVDEPRAYLEGTDEKFDIIQIVTAEGLAAGTSGLQSLHEDFLLTTEGMALAWQHLDPRGILAITRGIQTPPRDSLKLFATLQSALESQDIPDPDQHLALVRNYLAATILAFRNPVTEELSEPIRAAVDTLSLDVEWLPLFPPGSFKTRSVIAGPEGGSESYIAYGIKNILGTGREIFTDEWMYNIRPASDDSPYFYNFFRWESIGWLRDTYGPLWFRRLELGYMILVFVLIEAIVVGAALILLPLLGLRAAKGHAKGKLPTFLYFLFIGLGFMTLEMISILRFTRHLGEPLYATSLMIACYLLSAGTGSALSGRLSPNPHRGIVIATACIVVLGVLHIVTVGPIMTHFAGWPTAAKALLAIVLTLPLGFFMGWMFPCGLRIIGETSGSLVPWAWAVNGFASVAAPPLALMLSMSHGFRFALIIALACYTLAGISSHRLPRR